MGGPGRPEWFGALAASLGAAGAAWALALSLPLAASADVFKWYDENGVAHYTTDPDALPAAAPARSSELPRSELPERLPPVRAAEPTLLPDDRRALDTHALDAEVIDRFGVYGLPGPRELPPPQRIPAARTWPADPDARLAVP